MINVMIDRRLYTDVATAYGLSRAEARALVFAAAYGDRNAHLLIEAAVIVATAARAQ